MMSKIADAFIHLTCYTNSMKECERSLRGSNPLKAFAMSGDECFALETKETVCLPWLQGADREPVLRAAPKINGQTL